MSSPMDVKASFRDLVSSLKPSSKVAVIGHSDVDGLAATVIATRTFERLGHRVWSYVTKKGENAWSESVLTQVQSESPDFLTVVDLGSRGDPLLPGVRSVIIDHHKPTGVPEGATLISGYGLDPTPSSGLLAFWCAESLQVGTDLEWLAAASMLADYGDTKAFTETQAGEKALGTTRLRRLTTLLNAPRRTAAGDANPTLEMLLRTRHGDEVLKPPHLDVLLASKAEVDAALGRARKVAPKFAGNVALIVINEGCQVHPLVAQAWRNRLKKNIVMCANTGYLRDRVNFAMRTATPENLLEFLRSYKPAGTGEDYGRGHEKATGGSLTPEQWQEFLRSLGF